MIETMITLLIIAAAGFWFVRWFRGTASGETGCSCSGCSSADCPSRKAPRENAQL